MTEDDWLTSPDPKAMLEWRTHVSWSRTSPPTSISDRKLRLYAGACIRAHVRGNLNDEAMRSLKLSDAFADGIQPDTGDASKHGTWTCTLEGLESMLSFVVGHRDADHAFQANLLRCIAGNPYALARSPIFDECARCSGMGRVSRITAWIDPLDGYQQRTDEAYCPDCLGEKRFSHPRRWKVSNPDLERVALRIYDERDFSPVALSVLADALIDGGCANQDVLAHCREGGVHCRGCWVVDAVLGKE